eukprot:2528091-Alexandrium_andersonii.AAC.1
MFRATQLFRRGCRRDDHHLRAQPEKLSKTSPKRALGRFSLQCSRSARKTAQNGPLVSSGDRF